jgi:hypothetical protein
MLSGQAPLERPMYQFSAHATTRAGARLVANQLKAALIDYHGTLSGVVIQKIELQNELTILDTSSDGLVRVHITDLEFEVIYVKE